MLATSTSLSGAFATLRADLERVHGPAWMPEAIHALILAMLARIFDTLERMIHLWATNQLPPPPPPRVRAPRIITLRTARTPRHATPSLRPYALEYAAPDIASESAHAAAPHAGRPAPFPSARRHRRQATAILPPPVIRPAHDPPLPKSTRIPAHRLTPISFRNRNNQPPP